MAHTNIKTRAVAGAAYASLASTLTHAVDQDTGLPLCKRVKADNLLDDDFATDTNEPPTCPTCRKRDPRWR